MDSTAYTELFQAEATENMQVLNQCLLKLEKKPEDRESLLEAFRVVHSLKGMAGTMGYQQVADIAHCLEGFLEGIKSGAIEPAPEVLDLVFKAVDLLQQSLHHPHNPSPQVGGKAKRLFDRMQSIPKEGAVAGTGGSAGPRGELALGEMEREMIRQARQTGSVPNLVRVALRDNEPMKSVRCCMVLRALEEHGEVVFTVPPRHDLDEERFDRVFQVGFIPAGSVDPGRLESALLKLAGVEEVGVSFFEEPALPEGVAKNGSGGEAGEARAADKMVRVETRKLDELVNLVGELAALRNRIREVGRGYSADLDDAIEQLKRAIAGLQDNAIKLRMVPVKQVFDRFPRMVRDLSREKGKLVNLVVSGENTELDRSIINQLSDPLVHLLRNALDHGIEPPAVREAAGKDPAGTVRLKAHHEGSQVVITVEDDGTGIDPRAVIAKAARKGLIGQSEAARLQENEDEALRLIFQSGFSTSDRVTDISGRGMGLDVVRKSAEALHGSIEVESGPGEFTRFVLRFPLTLAIIKALMVRAAGEIYAIPIELIRENMYLQDKELRTIGGSPVANLRDEVIPLYCLVDLLGFTREQEDRGEHAVVIVEAGGKAAGLLVDTLLGQQEVMIKPVTGYTKGLQGIAGAAIHGDGSVALIIDPGGLLERRAKTA